MRDTLTAPDDADSTPFVRPILPLDADTTLHAALATMRHTRTHMALVTEHDQIIGVVTLADVLRQLLPHAQTA